MENFSTAIIRLFVWNMSLIILVSSVAFAEVDCCSVKSQAQIGLSTIDDEYYLNDDLGAVVKVDSQPALIGAATCVPSVTDHWLGTCYYFYEQVAFVCNPNPDTNHKYNVYQICFYTTPPGYEACNSSNISGTDACKPLQEPQDCSVYPSCDNPEPKKPQPNKSDQCPDQKGNDGFTGGPSSN